MFLKIVAMDGLKLSQEVASVTIPASGGDMQILPLHAGLVTLLREGEIRYDHSVVPIKNGIVRVYNDEVLVLID